jgi:hypothetical protein
METHANVVIVEDVFGEWFKLMGQNAICKFWQLITRIISNVFSKNHSKLETKHSFFLITIYIWR